MKFLNSIFYYGLIVPFSRLPFRVLYFFSDCLFFVLFYGIKYRRVTVRKNIEKSFPQMSVHQVDEVERKFFSHLMDLIFESVKLFTISKEQVQKRVTYKNPELVDRFFDEGKSVVVAVGHYNNWELVAASMDLPLKHQTIGIYKKLSNLYFDKKMIESRSKFGMKLVSTIEVKDIFVKERGNLTASIFGFDQSPSPASSPYWIKFLNQDTAVQFGTEKYSKEYNYPVVYGRMSKIKRGYYDFEFEEVTDQPCQTEHGEITEKINKLLERDINHQPEFWLWSHKRWKLQRDAPLHTQ